MTDHPLTDEILEDRFHIAFVNQNERVFDQDDMRSAADWQLERDTEYFYSYLVTVLGWDPVIAQNRMETFKKEMRPQHDD